MLRSAYVVPFQEAVKNRSDFGRFRSACRYRSIFNRSPTGAAAVA
ncbi:MULTISPECIES: hypothetical protein [Brevibacillus]|uniref:Uncharacterized protein n=1 Tax=Brevibacillus thermoruber TaxID=33942 RepID=A0A9X3Z4H2_9BACL|nr:MULTISPECIES: hypothetical protein [Brevibacillus]MDA5109595.1 hypothetical protein [Brevibacillus thermoruber]